MQVTETNATGLKRELKVVIGQGELGERFATRLDEVKDQVQLKGFRKGKVPVAHLKKLYGRSVMAEVLQQAVDENSRKAITDRKERPAHQPNINLTEDKDEIERVLTRPGRSRLHHVLRGAARVPDHRPGRPSARARGCRRPSEAVEKAIADLVERSVHTRSRRTGPAATAIA